MLVTDTWMMHHNASFLVVFFKCLLPLSGRILRAFINNWTIKHRRWRKEKKPHQPKPWVYLLFSGSYTSIPHEIRANSVSQWEWHWATANKPCWEEKHVGLYSALCYRHLLQPASSEYLLVLICQKLLTRD